MVMSSKESNLNEFVTSERLAELGRIISDANRILAAAVLVQGVALVLYYFLFPEDFSFWIVVPDALFVSLGVGALVMSTSKNPSEHRLSTGLTITKAALAASAVGLIASLLLSSNSYAFLVFLPGPLLSSVSFLARRIVAHDVRLRNLRGGPVGAYGNLEGLVADLTPYGVEPSTRIRPKHVATWMLFFEGMTTSSVLRGNINSPNRLPINSTLFWMSLLDAMAITVVIGLFVGIGLEWMRSRWNKAVNGRVKLDALQNSLLWFYGGNGAFACLKLFDRPMITVEDNQRLIIAHYPGSFETRTSSSNDFQLLVSVLQDKANYSGLGRRASSRA
jgi:hypothetical protein